MKLKKETEEKIIDIYNSYVRESMNIEDISRWVTKKTISKAVLNPTRTNEQKVLDALKGRNVQEGEKIFIYSAIDGETVKMAKGEPVILKSTGKPKMVPNRILKLQDEWNGDEDKYHYVKRVFKTLEIMKNVLDMDKFLNYDLMKNRKLIDDL